MHIVNKITVIFSFTIAGCGLYLNAQDAHPNSITAEIHYLQHVTSKRLNNRQASDVKRRIDALRGSIAEHADAQIIDEKDREFFTQELDAVEESIAGALHVAPTRPGSKKQRGKIGGVRELDITCRREVPIGDRSHCQ